MFSNLSSSSISLATVTPSSVMRGAPNDLSRTTLRPLGPSVTRTAWASVPIPCNILSRASTENLTSLADISIFPFVLTCWTSPNDEHRRPDVSSAFEACRFAVGSGRGFREQSCGLLLGLVLGLVLGRGPDQHSHDVALFHDEVLNAIDLNLGARPFAEQNAIADLHVHGNELAALVAAARSNGDDRALLWLLLCSVRYDDAAGGLRLGIRRLDNNAIMKRAKFH